MPAPMTDPVNRITGWLRRHPDSLTPIRPWSQQRVLRHLRTEHRNTYTAARNAGYTEDLLVAVHETLTTTYRNGSRSCYDVTQTLHAMASLTSRETNTAEITARLLRVVMALETDDRYNLKQYLDAFAAACNPYVRHFEFHQDWEWSFNWYEEYVRYAETGRLERAECLVHDGVPVAAAAVREPAIRSRRDHNVAGPGIVAKPRWIQMLTHAQWNLDRVLPLVPYLDEADLRAIPLDTITAWHQKWGSERTLLIARAGLDLTEGLSCTATDDSLRVLASLRSNS